jgi:hypothetical protein
MSCRRKASAQSSAGLGAEVSGRRYEKGRAGDGAGKTGRRMRDKERGTGVGVDAAHFGDDRRRPPDDLVESLGLVFCDRHGEAVWC